MSYQDRADADLKVAKLLISPIGNPTHDEMLYDNAAYHLEQAYEKELKYVLHDLLGVDDTTREFKTHNIADLISQIEDAEYSIPEAIKEISHDLTEWEASTRYNADISSDLMEIKIAISKFELLKNAVEEIETDINAKQMTK